MRFLTANGGRWTVTGSPEWVRVVHSRRRAEMQLSSISHRRPTGTPGLACHAAAISYNSRDEYTPSSVFPDAHCHRDFFISDVELLARVDSATAARLVAGAWRHARSTRASGDVRDLGLCFCVNGSGAVAAPRHYAPSAAADAVPLCRLSANGAVALRAHSRSAPGMVRTARTLHCRDRLDDVGLSASGTSRLLAAERPAAARELFITTVQVRSTTRGRSKTTGRSKRT